MPSNLHSVCLALTTALTFWSAAVSAQTLRILNWEAYLSDQVIAEWEGRTGAEVMQIYFDNDEIRDSILTSYDQDALDLVLIDHVAAQIFGSRGILEPVSSYRETDNLRHIDPAWQELCGDHSTPYMWGTMGLVYRKDQFPVAPASWQVLLAPSASLQGHIGLLEDYVDTLAPSLFVRGQSINTADEKVLAEVFGELRDILPAVLTFEYPLSFMATSAMADKLYLALAYGGDQYELNRLSGGDRWGYTIPKEGTVEWVDCLAVMSNSRNKALAFDFLNFINDPGVAARNSEALHVASPNVAAVPLQSASFRDNPLIYPDYTTIDSHQHYDRAMTTTNIRLRNRITSALVNLYESQ